MFIVVNCYFSPGLLGEGDNLCLGLKTFSVRHIKFGKFLGFGASQRPPPFLLLFSSSFSTSFYSSLSCSIFSSFLIRI